ncbi:hypothetical protein PPL_11425 [Heterostelium album PN500]|uniref:Uncharacterized protein n=1 Tax=Heterostelium pallidum (strain ATCC 26659 / Pp 5 / PN500) TaxID=670386 RepID=D3BTD1_HETP5|nr:hypothetical protein PPL_11425 [Heterostelium album PN500]EFA75348.1 hypothetical protein PPL_11425 [Heterostelium album PN500]|eukprot:XP_020427482.1 hypothetical protein PPL_11425 [Heterostelium album PN500]
MPSFNEYNNGRNHSGGSSSSSSKNVELYPQKPWSNELLFDQQDSSNSMENDSDDIDQQQQSSSNTHHHHHQHQQQHHQQQLQHQQNNNNNTIKILPREIPSGITSNGKWTYLYHENEIYIYDIYTGIRMTTFCFIDQKYEVRNHVLYRSIMIVTAVSELRLSDSIYLVAAVVNHQQQVDRSGQWTSKSKHQTV